MIRVRQHFDDEQIEDLEGAIRAELQRVGLVKLIKPGYEVAITAGSRGVTRIPEIIRAVAQAVKEAGGRPFIVPTMGSHGGATAEGQQAILHDYGITEEFVGAPIRATMEVVELGTTATGAKVYFDKNAYNADATIVVGRVKPHTDFRGPVESGLCKMIAIGLGKQRGAEQMHAHGLVDSIPQGAAIALEKANIILGLGIVENGYDQPHTVRATLPQDLYATDAQLLVLAKKLLPRIPFDELELLVVDWIGKNLSGAGMDPNVIGMWRRGRPNVEPKPFYRRILVRDLTPESHGNAVGIGFADFVTRKLVQKINWRDMYVNALTANEPFAVKVPITLESDQEALEVAYKSATAHLDGAPARVVRIHSTLRLEEFWVSEALLPAVKKNPRLQILSQPQPWQFDSAGNLLD